MEGIVPLRKATPNPFMKMISRHHGIEGVPGVQAVALDEVGLLVPQLLEKVTRATNSKLAMAERECIPRSALLLGCAQQVEWNRLAKKGEIEGVRRPPKRGLNRGGGTRGV